MIKDIMDLTMLPAVIDSFVLSRTNLQYAVINPAYILHCLSFRGLLQRDIVSQQKEDLFHEKHRLSDFDVCAFCPPRGSDRSMGRMLSPALKAGS